MVFSLGVLQHYAMSSVNGVCHLFRSAMIMLWAVCPSSVFKNWSKLPNSDWNADGAAGFTTIWVNRMFEDSCSALAMGAGFTTIWVNRRFEKPCNGLAMAAGFTAIWGDRRFEDSCDALAMAAGFTTIWVTEGLRTLAFLWQWPQSLQLSEWTEGLRIHAILWQWPFQAPERICRFHNDRACSAS